jgi:hypothetical protein
MTEEPKLKEMRPFLPISQEMLDDAFPEYPKYDWRHPIKSYKERKEWEKQQRKMFDFMGDVWERKMIEAYIQKILDEQEMKK